MDAEQPELAAIEVIGDLEDVSDDVALGIELYADRSGAGAFTLPGMVRVAVQQVPAKKARKGIDPFTKEERVFKAKPASVKLKARFFKKLKDAAL